MFLGNIAPTLQLKVLDQARDAKLVAMDTMNFWIETARDELIEVLRRVDVLLINDEEALQLSGAGSVVEAAGRIRALGPDYLVIKRGEFGAILFGPEGTLYVPALLLPAVVDPTGAGDTFAGGFIGYLSSTGAMGRAELGTALLTGTVMASFTVEAFSVDGICRLSAERVEERMNRLTGMIRF